MSLDCVLPANTAQCFNVQVEAWRGRHGDRRPCNEYGEHCEDVYRLDASNLLELRSRGDQGP